MKLVLPAPVVSGTVRLGYPESVPLGLEVVLLACTLVQLIPGISVLSGILRTGYLGGAGVTHVRVGDPIFTHVTFPDYGANMLWEGLCLREKCLQGLLPLRMERKLRASSLRKRGALSVLADE